MEKIVYLMCALTSIGCAFLLLRNYRRSKAKLLMWAGLAFACIAVSNIILFIDLGILPPSIDLSDYRDSMTFIGLLFLVFGLIWEGD